MKGTAVKVITGLLLLIISAFMSYGISNTTAADDNVTIDVNVSEVSEITVLPTSVSFNQLSPAAYTNIVNLTITNTGTVNTSNFYATSRTVSDEPTNPLGGGLGGFSATGFIWIRNTTGTTNNQFFNLGRQEWNLSNELTGEVLDLRDTTGNFSHGWYRNLTNFYLWKVENGTSGLCNSNDTLFTIKNDPENLTSGFVRDFTTGVTYALTPSDSNGNWSVFPFNQTGGPLSDHCIAVHRDCTRIMLYHFDKSESDGGYLNDFPICGTSQFLRESTLTPGEEFDAFIYASIPRGTPSGNAATGQLTIVAS